MKVTLLFAIAATFISTAVAKSPHFAFTSSTDSDTVIDSVDLPYTRENPDGQCITHPEPVGAILEKDDVKGQKYCYYGFTDSTDCTTGGPNVMQNIKTKKNAHFELGGGGQKFQSSVIRKNKCPDGPIGGLIPYGEGSG